jgi:hypothetical protein
VRAAEAPIRAAISSWIALLAAASACSAAPSGPKVGVSTAGSERVSAPPVEARRELWSSFVAARAWPEAAPSFVARVHRRDGTHVRVHVDPASLDAYRQLAVDSPMPAEARVVAWHETPVGELLGGYVLEKRAGTWSALEVDAAGQVVPGDRAPCLRCHELAPSDYLFGPPQSSASAGESPAALPR